MKDGKVSFILSVCVLFIASCSEPQQTDTRKTNKEEQLVAEGSCQYLTQDQNGNPVICWVKEDSSDHSNNVVQYSSWNIKQSKFGEPITIASTKGVQSHEEGMPKIAFKQNGEIFLVYSIPNASEEHKYAALIYYVKSDSGRNNWSAPIPLVPDSISYSQRFFDISSNPRGELSMIWLDSRKEKDTKGSSLYYAETTAGKGFSTEKKITESTCECCRTELHSSADGVLHIAYRDIIQDSIRDMCYINTKDGISFSEPARISNDNWILNGCPHTGPSLTTNKKETHFTWYTQGGREGIYYCNTTDGKTFSNRVSISESGKHPQITASGEKIYVVYEQLNKKDGKIERPIMLWTNNGQPEILSKQNIKASFPVIQKYHDQLLVAWSETNGNTSKIKYKLIALN